MQIRVQSVEFYIDECTTRIPFRFGMTTMTSAPLLTARVGIETEDGTRAWGFSSDLAVPKWFEKNPDTSAREDIEALLDSARAAARSWCDPSSAGATVFDHWWRVYQDRVQGTAESAPDRLVRGFGVALVERAVMDAACRAANCSFFAALRDDLFGFRPGLVFPQLEGWSLAKSLPARPSSSVELRHTVGLADPIRADDVAHGSGVDDGLPHTLEQNVHSYGLGVFKIKIGGSQSEDLERLRAIAEVLTAGGAAPRWTADGNEQFTDLGALGRLLDELEGEATGRRFLQGLLYIEQPLPRASSFDPQQATGLAALGERAPVILDEADHGVEAFPRGLDLGYSGVSVKNCKGVFRALLNRGVCDTRGGGAFQSAEDLTNLGVLALQQDLATVAALGLPHVERNGHHYFHGLDHLPAAEARDALAMHPDLYEPLGEGATMRVSDGSIEVGSLDTPGYGYGVEIRTGERTPLDDWRPVERAR